MKSFVTACFLLTVFFGNLADIGIVKLYAPLGPGPFFAMMGMVMIVLAGAIVPVGRKFNRSAAEGQGPAVALAPATALADGTAPDEAIMAQEGVTGVKRG
jgi:hypothetical protein